MKLLGRVLFIILWPFVWLYSPLTRRARVLITSEDRVLLVKNWFGPGRWQLPGGGIKWGEKVKAAAKREILEELGLTVDELEQINHETITMRQFGLLMRYEFVKVDLDEATNLEKSREITDVAWMTREKISNIRRKVSPEVRYALKHASKK